MIESVPDISHLSRSEAGKLLAKSISEYCQPNTVVVAINRGGAAVAFEICSTLYLPLEFMSSMLLKHPGNRSKSIGSLCRNETVLHDCPYSLPQDYIQYQIAVSHKAIIEEEQYFYGKRPRLSLKGKVVIIVLDEIKSSDRVAACLVSIKKELPLRIIVAAAVISETAATFIRKDVDDLIFLKMFKGPKLLQDDNINFPKIDIQQFQRIIRLVRECYQKPLPTDSVA